MITADKTIYKQIVLHEPPVDQRARVARRVELCRILHDERKRQSFPAAAALEPLLGRLVRSPLPHAAVVRLHQGGRQLNPTIECAALLPRPLLGFFALY